MQSTEEIAAKTALLAAHGIGPAQLLNRGMEAEVYALGDKRVLKLYSGRATFADLQTLQHFYATLDRQVLPYALPEILAVETQAPFTIVIERQLVGRPLSELVAERGSAQLDDLLQRYLLAVLELRKLRISSAVERYKLFDAEEISATAQGDWHHFLGHYLTVKQRQLAPYLVRDVEAYATKVTQIQTLLATPYVGPYALIHGDFFPGNLLVDERGNPTALIDFGLFTMIGDPLFDVATACAFFDMYDELGADLRERLFALACAELGEAVRPLLYRYLLLYSFLSANTYSAECTDGHYAWCVANLNTAAYWELVV